MVLDAKSVVNESGVEASTNPLLQQGENFDWQIGPRRKNLRPDVQILTLWYVHTLASHGEIAFPVSRPNELRGVMVRRLQTSEYEQPFRW